MQQPVYQRRNRGDSCPRQKQARGAKHQKCVMTNEQKRQFDERVTSSLSQQTELVCLPTRLGISYCTAQHFTLKPMCPPGGAHRSNEVRIFSLMCGALHCRAAQSRHCRQSVIFYRTALQQAQRARATYDKSREQQTRENHENSVEESIRMTEDRDKWRKS